LNQTVSLKPIFSQAEPNEAKLFDQLSQTVELYEVNRTHTF